MTTNADHWDDRYRQPGYWAGTAAANFLQEVLPLLPHGAALDIACGEGRNAVYLASQGWHVTAVDRSRPALQKAQALACGRYIAVSLSNSILPAPPRKPQISLFEADLESFRLPTEVFDLIVCFNYLQRSLWPLLVSALRPNGALVYETYTIAQLQFAEGPRNPEFLLRPGELLDAFPDLEVLFYRELTAGKGISSLVARKPSLKKSNQR